MDRELIDLPGAMTKMIDQCPYTTVTLLLSLAPFTHHQAMSAATLQAVPVSTALSEIKQLLQKSLRITLTDGRIFLGTFAGTDKQLNILLINTDEFRLTPPELANPNGRFVGLVMIPRRLVVRIEAPCRDSGDRDMYA